LAIKFRVARTVKDAGRDLARLDALGLGQRLDVVGRIGVQVHHAVRIARANGDLGHIAIGRVQQAAAFGHGDHGQRVRHRLGAQRGAFQRVQRDVDLGALAQADLLADVQHRRFVALALADHHHAIHLDVVERGAHGVHGKLVGLLFIATAAQGGSGNGGSLRHAGNLDGQDTVQHVLSVPHGGPLCP
jgi:hypothetical protein